MTQPSALDTSMPCTVQDALTWAQALGLPRLEAQILLLHVWERALNDRAWLLTQGQTAMSNDKQQAFAAQVKRRLAHEPVAYITGRKEFFGLTLHVDARVLDPRPDTETLVEWALSCLADIPSPHVVDLGTGSGAIALAIKHTRADAQVYAVDASHEALIVARANAARLNLAVDFYEGSWLSPLDRRLLFDAIVANPPYIASADPHLSLLHCEPVRALVAGNDGLSDLRTIVGQAGAHLRCGGWLLLEHGHDQAPAVQDMLGNAGFTQVQSHADLAGIWRCSGGRWSTVK